jgi:hypothetical protein
MFQFRDVPSKSKHSTKEKHVQSTEDIEQEFDDMDILSEERVVGCFTN